MYIVQLNTLSGTHYLRSTIWTCQGHFEHAQKFIERAQKFETIEEAKAQLEKAKQFMSAEHYKAAKIVEI